MRTKLAVLVALLLFGVSGLAVDGSQVRDKPHPVGAPMDVLAAQTSPENALAERYAFFRSGRKPLQPGEQNVTSPLGGAEAALGPTTESSYLRTNVCAVDAIVMGTPSVEKVLLNKTKTFLFTLYSVQVTRWFAPLDGTNPSSIAISQPGGTVTVDGKLTWTTVPDYPPLAAKLVILFLKKLDEAPPYYETAGTIRVVELKDGEALITPMWAPAAYIKSNADALMAEISKAKFSCK